MEFKPKTEKEIAEMGLWLPGVVSFEVIEYVTFGDRTIHTSEATSKNGNQMIILVVNCVSDNGESKILIDYIVESAAAKLRNVCVACGLLDKYDIGVVYASDFIGKRGDLRIGIEKDKTGQYPDKNKIINYITDSTPKKDLHPYDPANMDDGVPF